jgi:YD repeat-containing protein
MKSLRIKMNNKKLVFLLMLLASTYKLLAQSSLPTIQAPIIQLPSLTAQAFMRYGEIPVDNSTGVPDISIPLYTVKSKKLELPISLSYHASGIKVNDVASEVGLGWVLNCGGLVSKTIFGKRDESIIGTHTYTTAQQMYNAINSAFTYNSSCDCYPDLWDFNEYVNSNFYEQDPQVDRYYYCLPNGISGVFRSKFLNSDTIITLPYRPLKIEKTLDGNVYSGFTIQSIKITDENGILYLFEPYQSNLELITNTTDFYLKGIYSQDGKDSIKITYDVTSWGRLDIYSNTFISPILNSEVYLGPPQCNSYSTDPLAYDPFPHFTTSNSFYFEAPKISTIVTPLTTVTFNYNYDRSDFNLNHRLNNITIVSNTTTSTLKTISFKTFYFGTGNSSRLGLDSVKISSPNNYNPEIYTFKYENQTLPVYTGKLPYHDSYNEDFWGYNNNSNSPSLVPRDLVPIEYRTYPQDYNNFCGNRDPDTTASKACMIKEIKYPTGGRTVFKFERNYANNIYQYKSNPDGFVGGYRVHSISNYDENNKQADLKTYEYFNAVAPTITLAHFKYSTEYWYKYHNPDYEDCLCVLNYTRDMISSNSFLPLEVAPGLPIVYSTVVEYHGTKTNNVGKTVYEYNLPYSPNSIYDTPDNSETFDEPRYIHPYHWDKGNYVPELASKFEYSFDGQHYHPIFKSFYTYSKLFTREYQTGIQLTKLKEYLNINAFQTGYVNSSEYYSKIIAGDTKAYREASLLTRKEDYNYNPIDSTKYIVSTTDLEYESKYLQLKRKTISTSVANTNRITEYHYPFDYTTNSINNTMVTQHKVSSVIQQIDKLNNTELLTTKTSYRIWDGLKIIEPDTIVATKDGQIAIRLLYKYDTINGNLVETAKDKDIKTSYIWGYNHTYPVAKFDNLSYSAILSNTSLYNYINQLQNYTDVFNINTRTSLKLLNENIRNNLPPNVMVNTYTYKPLFGITSHTDANGITTYYEYDSFGRLECIKDNNQYILKHIEYHIKPHSGN